MTTRTKKRQAIWTTMLFALAATGAWADPPDGKRNRGLPGDVVDLQREIAELQRELIEVRSVLSGHYREFGDMLDAICAHYIAQGIPPLDICPINSLPSRTIFVTSVSFDGDLGGLSGADAICQELADSAANISGTYKAWLSDSVTHARDRLLHNPGPYRLPNGVVVAESWNDLVDGTIHQPIRLTEHGVDLGGAIQANVWTATAADGTLRPLAGTCDDWTNNTLSGKGGGNTGTHALTGPEWTVFSGDICTPTDHGLYCLQQ